MPEVVDLLQKTNDEIKAELLRVNSQLRADHVEVNRKLVALSERVQSLEHSEKITRWLFGGGGAILALCARELIVKYLL